MKKIQKGKVLNIKNVALDTFKLEMASEVKEAAAGQFISVLCPPKTLRRPFSIAGFCKGKIAVLFKVKGEGTQYLKSLKSGDEVDFLGPLGNGFEIKNKKSLLVGAGIGIAPMLFLKDSLNKENIENFLITGFRAENEIIAGSDETVIGGSVLDRVPEIIEKYKPEVIYSCGPKIVLEKLCQIALKEGIECYVAMEKVMACGIGVCRGCVIKVKNGENIENAAICKDGPVFEGRKVLWE